MAEPTTSTYRPTTTTVDVLSNDAYGSQPLANGTSSDTPSKGCTININNKFFERMNTCANTYFYVVTISLYIAIMTYADDVYRDDGIYVKLFATYVLANIFGNYYFCCKYNAGYNPADMGHLPSEKWAFCIHCQHTQPPRCHHCPLCHKCVTKRDHHCFFISACVGERNQGYFAIYCFHVAIGFVLGFTVLSNVLTNTYYEVVSLDFYHYLPPVALFDLLRGRADLLTFCLVLLLCVSFLTGIFTTAFFLWQCLLIVLDLTSYEAHQAWTRGGLTWSKLRPWYNVKAAFGTIPLLSFLLPLPTTRSIPRIAPSKMFL